MSGRSASASNVLRARASLVPRSAERSITVRPCEMKASCSSATSATSPFCPSICMNASGASARDDSGCSGRSRECRSIQLAHGDSAKVIRSDGEKSGKPEERAVESSRTAARGAAGRVGVNDGSRIFSRDPRRVADKPRRV
eukprot:scaffold37299_cov57-Phaeocystis_antarctica.AAC.3